MIIFITPDSDQIRSVFSEYQLSESAFDAESLLAASGPEASVEDIHYGGDLTGDVDDQ